jgi:Ubiquitin-activating enzyme E1 FCCH domain
MLQASSCLVSGITKDSPALVTVMDDTRHHLDTGDVVTFSSLQVSHSSLFNLLFLHII